MWKKSKRVLAFLCGSLVMISLSAPSAAAEGNYSQTEGKIVRVAMLQYPNFIDYDEGGRPTGFSCDYLDEIAKYTGWVYEYVPVSFTQAQTMLENGEIDIAAGTQYTQERAEKYDYSALGMTTDANVLCVPASDTSYYYNDFAALDGMDVGVMTGSLRKQQFAEVLEEKGVSVNFQEFDTDDAEKAALRDGKVKAILMTSLRCTSDYRIIASTNATNVYFTCNPHDPAIKAGIDEAQREIMSFDPYFNMRLYEKYYDSVPRAYAFSDEERQYLAHAGTITVAISPDMKPTEYYDVKTDSFHGMVVDYFERIGEITGLKFQYVVRGDEDSTVRALNGGTVQLIASAAENGNVENTYPVTLTNSYYLSSVCLAYNKEVSDPLSQDCKIVLKSGFAYYQSLAHAQGYTNLAFCDTLEECVAAVNKGDADITYLPGYSASRLTDHAYLDHIKLFVSPVAEYQCGIGVSRQCDRVLVSILDKALSSISTTEQNRMLMEAIANNKDQKTWRDSIYENVNLFLCIIIAAFLVVGIISAAFASRRKKANLQLAAAMDSAQRANKAKSDFLSRMSHDMRTPLNGILGLAGLIKERVKDESVLQDLAQMQASGQYLLNLINDTLDVSRIENGKLELHPTVCDGKSIFDSVVSLGKAAINAKKINLEVRAEELTYPMLFVDVGRVEQIMMNIIGNAVKFTPENGKITCTIKNISVKDGVITDEVCIRDTGIGMSKEFLPHIFEPFSQADSSRKNVNQGTGLGMNITKQIVELMGGSISVESEPGVGTAITVTLVMPIAAEEQIAEWKRAQSGAAEYRALVGKRVLLVEDHPLNAKIATRLLAEKGIQVDHAENGAVGLALFENAPVGHYQAILMDIRMPVMDGIEAAEAIRRLSKEDAQSVPIIAMTANAYDDDVRATQNAGMNAHLSKPVEPEALFQVLAEQINRKKG